MVRIIETEHLGPKVRMSPNENAWTYNGLDCCVTLEIRDVLRTEIDEDIPEIQATYANAMQKMAPITYMCLRGTKIDKTKLRHALDDYKTELARLEGIYGRLCMEVMGYSINWRSPTQLMAFFYDTLKLKKQYKRTGGKVSPTVDGEALEKLSMNTFASIFCHYILALRETGKKISFLESEYDEDGRMRTQYNIAGTKTGRLNSKFNIFDSGTNLQNVEDKLREPFIADDGMLMVNIDLSQADARTVGARLWNIFYYSHGPEAAGKYLDACESGDLHSTVTSMVWPSLAWPSDRSDLAAMKAVAEQGFYRHYSYRDMSKRLGHGTNFFGKPYTMAVKTKVAQDLVMTFQKNYFGTFPLIGDAEHNLSKNHWHGWVQKQLEEHQAITTLFGRRRMFHNRPQDQSNLRDAIAYEPQSCTGEFLDRGWLNLYHNMPEAELLLPVHDSILFQIPLEGADELVPRALELMKVTLELEGGREFTIPLDCATGFNWRKAKLQKDGRWINEYGLKDWQGHEERTTPKRARGVFAELGRKMR